MRKRHNDEFIDGVAQDLAILADAVVVRAIAATDRHAPLVKPDDVAAFDQTGCLNRTGDVNAPGLQRPSLRVGLRGTLQFAHATEHHAARR